MTAVQKFDIALAVVATLWLVIGYFTYVRAIVGSAPAQIAFCRNAVQNRMVKIAYTGPVVFYGVLVAFFAFTDMKYCSLIAAIALVVALVETVIIQRDMFGLRTRMLSKSQIS